MIFRLMGSWLGLKFLMRKLRPYRWIIITVVVLLVLALFNPVLDLIGKVLDLFGRVMQPLMETTVGRIVLILLFSVVTALVLAALLRGRIRELRCGLVLGRHLQGVAALIGDDVKLCRDRLQKVARYQGPRPDAYPALVQDANLKLARLALRHGRPEQVLLHLARVPEQGLPKELERSLRQLRVRALRLQGSVPVETLVAELEEALARFKDDYVLCCELRTIRREQGELAAATVLQQRAVDLAPPSRVLEEQQRLRLDLEALGQEALKRGDVDTAKRAAKDLRKADREGASWGLLQGRVLEAEGDLRGAVKNWGATRSPEGLDLIAALLREHPDVMEPRELLECCPMQGTLLVVARMLARKGETEKAERAARLAADALGPTDSVVGALTEVLQLLGREQQARLLCEQAVRRLVARDESAR